MTWSRRTWAVAIVVGTLVTVGYVYLAIVAVPEWRADRIKSSKSEAQTSARENERVSVRTAMLAVLAGAIAAAGAVYTGRTYALNKRETARTFELNRRGQRTDRFTRAVDQLGEDGKLDVRLGGIYALEQLAQESAEDHGPIMEVLCAYVRGHALAKERERPVEEPLGEGPPADDEPGVQPWAPVGNPPVDIQAVITVLARRREDHDARGRVVLDLRHADLRFVDIRGLPAPFAHLDGAIFFDANLTEAIVTHANLAGAYLDGAICFAADLSQADLSDAYLRGAYLTGANLTGANLTRANLTRANLTANLTGAILIGGTLTAANLNNAILPGANLIDATLHGATLTDADLTSANLASADLTDADLRGATLTGANLTDAHLNNANLASADLFDAYLRGADLTGADLTDADLRGATLVVHVAGLSVANLTDAILRGARADVRTQWPDEFKFKDAGVQLVDGDA